MKIAEKKVKQGFPSLMAEEIAQISDAAARLITEGDVSIRKIATDLKGRDFSHVVLCGRGSSGHAGVYLRYLIETQLGYAVANAAPSIATSYRAPPKAKGELFIVVSQSGRSPDLLAATEAARKGGAFTLALVNDEASPVARAADRVLPILAGEEQAVAATKSVVNSLIAGALLVAHMADDDALHAAINHLPERLAAALGLDWSTWGNSLQQASATFVIGRGYGLGIAREIALKLAETLRLPSLAYSAAEFRHGPRAAASKATPTLLLRQADAVAEGTDELAQILAQAGVPVFMCGGSGKLPWLGDDHPVCDSIAMLVPAYKEIERQARARGLDPDKPAGLTKITETL